MSTDDSNTADRGSELSAGLGPLVVSPCLACPTPGKCTDTDRCVTPKAGETWYILRAGATACATLKIAEITARTVLFESGKYGIEGERIPFGLGLRFIERVSGPNAKVSGAGTESDGLPG